MLGAEHARLDLERPLELKKGVFEVALLSVQRTNVVVCSGHPRVLLADHPDSDLEIPVVIISGLLVSALLRIRDAHVAVCPGYI